MGLLFKMIVLILFVFITFCGAQEFYKTTAIKTGKRLTFFTMAESDALAAEFAIYNLLTTIYNCLDCNINKAALPYSYFRMILTDWCPYPGKVDDAYWSLGQPAEFLIDRTLDGPTLYYFNKHFPGFERDFIITETPDGMREQFLTIMLPIRILKVIMEKERMEQDQFWSFFEWSEQRTDDKYRPMLGFESFYKEKDIGYVDFKEIWDLIGRFNSTVGEYLKNKTEAMLAKAESFIMKGSRVRRQQQFTEFRNIKILDKYYPLHREIGNEVEFNNIFAELMNILNSTNFTEDLILANIKLPAKFEQENSTKSLEPRIPYHIQKQNMQDSRWHRAPLVTHYQIPPNLISHGPFNDMEEWWIVQNRTHSKLITKLKGNTQVCDKNHWQFRLTDHGAHHFYNPEKDIGFEKRKAHGVAQSFVIMRDIAILWPTAIQVIFATDKCFFECPPFGKIYHSAGCQEEKVCDYEPSSECDWYFTNSHDLAEAEKQELSRAKKQFSINVTYTSTSSSYSPGFVNLNQKKHNENNFNVVVGMVGMMSGRNTTPNHYAYYSSKKASNNTPMIVSPYYQHSSASCSLMFHYKIIGGSDSSIIVSTQLIPLHAISSEDISDEEAIDWVNPTVRKIIPATKSEALSITIPIGEVEFPTRIRLECHSGDTKNNNIMTECFIDNVRLTQCEEHVWQPNVCSMDSHPKRYLCHRFAEQKCIDFADVCDMHFDCPNREDEDNTIQNCKLAPPSARCDFEETRYEAGCDNWVIINSANAIELIKLTSVAEALSQPKVQGNRISSAFRQTKMPMDKTFANPNSGHYLMFSTFGNDYAVGEKFEESGGLLYSHAMTPIYPRMDPRLKDSSNKLHGRCMVRFFYCHIGSTNFQIILERLKTRQKKVIWTPPRSSLIEPCVWEKAAITLDYQPAEYFLKFGIAKMNNHKAMFLLDDFSMTPDCFLMRSVLLESTLPPSITLTTCGLIGSIAPTAKQCENLPESSPRIDGELPISGRRSFMIDKRIEYRIELHGAAGGQLPISSTSNFGGIVIINLFLDLGDEVTFVVGQRGESPCNSRTISTKQQSIQSLLCNKNSRSITKLQEEDILNLPGSGGGGASAIFVNGEPIAIAGGGGGLFFTDGLSKPSNVSSNGGHSFKYISATSRRALRSDGDPSLIWTSGSGGSFDDKTKSKSPTDCTDCLIMTGQFLSASNAKAGICPKNRTWNMPGGFGGGGAACGPGAGGGGGFIGGMFGFKANGEGGSSAVFAPVQKDKQIAKIGINDGNGKIVLRACTMPCVVNATCRFEDPVLGQIPKAYCECSNGRRVTGTESCESAIEGMVGKVRKSFDVAHPKTLLSLALIGLLLLLSPCCCCILYRSYSHRKKAKAFENFHNELQMIATDPLGMGNSAGAIVTRGSISSNGQLNLITGNPIYQYTDLFDVPHINRDWCEFHDVIGHGAFGEVRSGTFNRPNEAPFKVAIKTLPFESNPEIIHDFQTEAKILANFGHPNIVRFFGVCFDTYPKFIVLELLEGGDLKNYLRECRPKGSYSSSTTGSSSVPTSPTSPMAPNFQLMMVDLVQMSLDVARGCEYLECNKFVHRDIAARNCLLTSKNPLMRTVKIADFGMARDIYRNDYYRKGGRAFLPVKWMPPESFLDGIFTSKTDVWAFGVLLWEIFSMGYTPYPGRQNQEVMQLVVTGGRLDPPIGTPEEIYNFMIRCWETNSDARPTFKQTVMFLGEMLKHPKVSDAPLPPIVYKHGHKPSSTPPTTRSSAPPGDNDQTNPISTASQATISTLVTSMTESTTTSSYDSMPTKGEGVTHNLCPPYETKLTKPIMSLSPLERIASGDDSISSHDDSTLHDTCSVKQSPYKIEKQPSLQGQKSSGSLNQGAPASTPSLPFHKRIFRKSMEKPKSGPSQPLIQSAGPSSTASSPPPAQPSGRQPKRGLNDSPPLPSQLI